MLITEIQMKIEVQFSDSTFKKVNTIRKLCFSEALLKDIASIQVKTICVHEGWL